MAFIAYFVIEIIIILIILCLVIGVYQKNTNAICQSKKRLDGRTVLVTGGTTGMGLEIAVDLARRGARVIIACPFEDEGESAKKHIINLTNNENVVFKHLNLGSLESVREFASDIAATEDRLDILINNAGIGTTGNFVTKDGMHFLMQVNYFGAFQLTMLLLPLLKKSGQSLEPSRIVNTSSITHWLGKVDFDKMNKASDTFFKQLFLLGVYSNSKLCLALFSHELAKKLKGSNVTVNSVDPGAVGTRIFDSCTTKFLGLLLKSMSYCLFKTPWQGAQTALHVALDRKAGEVSGQFFKNCQLAKARPLAYDDETSKKLWEESVRLVRLCEEEMRLCFKN